MKSWNWSWEKMCKLEKGQSCVFCFSPSTAHFCISFVHPSSASWEPWNKDGPNPSAHQPDKRHSSLEAEFCVQIISGIPSIHTMHDHTHLDLSNLEYLYLLIITDTVFTLGLKEQRPFPDSHLESILKICSWNVDLCVTSHLRNHQMWFLCLAVSSINSALLGTFAVLSAA